MADGDFVNAVKVNGKTWAQRTSHPASRWWRTDARITTVESHGTFIDLDNWPDSRITELENQLAAVKALRKKVKKSDYKLSVGYAKSGQRVRDKAARIERKNLWFA